MATSREVAQVFTDSAAPGVVNLLLSELLVDILDDLPDSELQLMETGGEPPSAVGLW
jgi:hypothetical protein